MPSIPSSHTHYTFTCHFLERFPFFPFYSPSVSFHLIRFIFALSLFPFILFCRFSMRPHFIETSLHHQAKITTILKLHSKQKEMEHWRIYSFYLRFNENSRSGLKHTLTTQLTRVHRAYVHTMHFCWMNFLILFDNVFFYLRLAFWLKYNGRS